MANFCEKIKFPEEKIAEGFYSEVFLIYLKNGEKRVVKKFWDSIISEDKKGENINETLEKYKAVKKADITVLDLYYSHDKIYSDFLNIDNRVALSNNIDLKNGVVYFDNNNEKRIFNSRINITSFNKILDQLVEIFWKAEKNGIMLYFDTLFYLIDLNKENQNDLKIIVGDFDKVKLYDKDVDLKWENYDAVWGSFQDFLNKFFLKRKVLMRDLLEFELDLVTLFDIERKELLEIKDYLKFLNIMQTRLKKRILNSEKKFS